MTYTATEYPTIIIRDADNVSFSTNDPANMDYAAYLAWLAEGNTPSPYIPPPEPAPLTPQEKLAAAGLSVDELKTLLGIS